MRTAIDDGMDKVQAAILVDALPNFSENAIPETYDYQNEALTHDGALISFRHFLFLIFHPFSESEEELQKKAVEVAAVSEPTHAADDKPAEMVEGEEEEQPFVEDAEIHDVE